ncbi:MAG TPA: heme o synthase [Candidatus Saccharimonadales bacterium]|nr:heme o synthase [Candidatus Saccharimonadales bacterium]
MIKDYYQLTKPGIIYGNLLTAAAGFFLASRGQINFSLFIYTMLGIALVIGSACVFNNVIDREIDSKMKRTKIRSLVVGKISVRSALIYASFLGLAGFGLLAWKVNYLTVLLGLIAFVDYIVFYGITKRQSVHGTLVGSISGAMPIVAGYCAVTNQVDAAAILLFLILVFWQMPHFYAIAIYRLKDYQEAKIPVLPLVSGIPATKVQMVVYTAAFVLATLSLTFLGYTNYIYFVVMGVLGLVWLWRALEGFRTKNDERWARKFFLYSLVLILGFSVVLSVGSLLP